MIDRLIYLFIGCDDGCSLLQKINHGKLGLESEVQDYYELKSHYYTWRLKLIDISDFLSLNFDPSKLSFYTYIKVKQGKPLFPLQVTVPVVREKEISVGDIHMKACDCLGNKTFMILAIF